MKQVRCSLLLVLTALIWGVAFVAQSVGTGYVGPFTFNACRFLIGGLVLIPFMGWMRKGREKKPDSKAFFSSGRKWSIELAGGVGCGCFLCLGSVLQQIGISETTVGKAGFITSLYIIIVPFLGLFCRRKVARNVLIGAVMALAGMYLLCIGEGFSISRGDFFVFLCSVAFSLHILVIDYVSPRGDGVMISCIQFFTAGLICSGLMVCFEKPSLSAVISAWGPIAYAGVMSCGVAYTLQVVAQKHVEPTVASLILSLESVFSVIAGWVLLGQELSSRERAGCILVFLAILLAQIPVSVFARAKGKAAEY